MAKNSSKSSFPQVDFALTNLTKIRQNCQIHGHSLGLTKFRLWDDLDFGKLDITPLGIYSFPCSVGFVWMKTSLAACPKVKAVIPHTKGIIVVAA